MTVTFWQAMPGPIIRRATSTPGVAGTPSAAYRLGPPVVTLTLSGEPAVTDAVPLRKAAGTGSKRRSRR